MIDITPGRQQAGVIQLRIVDLWEEAIANDLLQDIPDCD